MTTPLHTVKEKFGSKSALVSQLVGMLPADENESTEELQARLMRVSNRKLLVLHERETVLKSNHGTRDALVEKLVQAKLGRNDADLTAKLNNYSNGRLLSLARSL